MTSGPILVVDIQNALSVSDVELPPNESQLSSWATLAHRSVDKETAEVTLRLVSETEMTELNEGFRGKQGPTNVLSFPVDYEYDSSMEDGPPLLGDIVICHTVIVREANEQNKLLAHHYAHMVTHGVLHLHGYDHVDDVSAQKMESLEASILSLSAIENPYI